MEGLEAVEIPWSVLERTKRLDSEYFLKEHLFNASLLRKHGTRSIASCTNISDGNHFAVSDQFVDEGLPYYRGQDVVGHFFIEQSTPVSITTAAYDTPSMKRSHLKNGDVLLSIVGSIGEASLVSSERSATCSCKLAILRPQSIAPAYLASFLRSKYGRRQTQRLTRGAIQMGLLLEDMDQVLVPEFSGGFEKILSKVIADSKTAIEVAESSIVQAELTLLQALGLDNWQAPEPLSYVRNSREAFGAGRLDAEHFQPKYKALIDAMTRSGKDFQLVPLGNISAPLKYGCSDKLEYVHQGRVFLRIADLESKRFNPNSVLHIPADSVFGESDLVEKGDVLISRSGTLGVAVPITNDFSGSAYGSYFIRSRPDLNVVHPEFLALFINSWAGQMQVEQKNTGGIQTNLTIPAIESLLIPIGSINWQMHFVKMVYLSLFQRQRATQLLDAAKRAVEIAIEDSEAAALAYLEGVNP